MRVQRQEIRLFQAGKLLRCRQRRQTAISAVDVQPKALLAGKVGDLVQRVDRAADHRTAGGDDGDRQVTSRAIGRNGGLERIHSHPEGGIDRDEAEIIAADTQECRRPSEIEKCTCSEA